MNSCCKSLCIMLCTCQEKWLGSFGDNNSAGRLRQRKICLRKISWFSSIVGTISTPRPSKPPKLFWVSTGLVMPISNNANGSTNTNNPSWDPILPNRQLLQSKQALRRRKLSATVVARKTMQVRIVPRKIRLQQKTCTSERQFFKSSQVSRRQWWHQHYVQCYSQFTKEWQQESPKQEQLRLWHQWQCI